MRRCPLRLLGGFCLSLLSPLVLSCPAHAAPSRGHVQVGGALMYTLSLEEGPVNPWGPGLGIRAGYTLRNDLYLGALADFHLGEENASGARVRAHLVGGAIGYDVRLSRSALIRPALAVGVHLLSRSIDVGSSTTSRSENDPFLAPGVAILFFADRVILGPEARLNTTLGDVNRTSMSLAFNLGLAL